MNRQENASSMPASEAATETRGFCRRLRFCFWTVAGFLLFGYLLCLSPWLSLVVLQCIIKLSRGTVDGLLLFGSLAPPLALVALATKCPKLALFSGLYVIDYSLAVAIIWALLNFVFPLFHPIVSILLVVPCMLGFLAIIWLQWWCCIRGIGVCSQLRPLGSRSFCRKRLEQQDIERGDAAASPGDLAWQRRGWLIMIGARLRRRSVWSMIRRRLCGQTFVLLVKADRPLTSVQDSNDLSAVVARVVAIDQDKLFRKIVRYL